MMRIVSTSYRSLLLGGAVLLLSGAAAAAPSTNATVNLIQLLINNKVITKAAGEALLAQAEAEAAGARAALAKATPPAIAPATEVAVAGALPPPPPGSVRVPYIPEPVKAQMTNEIREDIMAQAEFEGWARPNQLPAWTKNITIYGDLRIRYESDLYSNNNAREQINFAAFNDLSPIDINGRTNPTGFPLLNTTQDHSSILKLRARIGIDAKVNDNVSVGVRIATGDDNSPISTNQVLGGGWSKKAIWLDQAWVKVSAAPWASATLGRFANPFLNTDLLFDDDLNLDGAIVQLDGRNYTPENVTAGLTVGAFPFGYGGANFPTYSPDKTNIGNKWMFGGQGKVSAVINDHYTLTGAVAYYHFDNVQGQLSEPCPLYNGSKECSTDQLRPTFLRKGNTLFLMRDIAADPASPTNYAQPQVLGLSFNYNVLDIQANVRVPVSGNIGIELQGDYINNLGYKQSDLCRYDPQGLPINNVTVAPAIAGASPITPAGRDYTNPCTPQTDIVNGVSYTRIAAFNGGNQGYLLRALAGYSKPKLRGEWNVELGYRYLQSDAILDSLPDSDFHLGGTNTRGFLFGGRYAIFKNLLLGAKWYSANEVDGPPLAIDVLMLDMTASF